MNKKQQIILSGTGGQGILFLARFFSEAALHKGFEVLTSETHGMAMRGGTVVSHVKIGPFVSPLIRWGQADAALFLSTENLLLHQGFVSPGGAVFINTTVPDIGSGVDASGIAAKLGASAGSNMALLGFAVASDELFCNKEVSMHVLGKISTAEHREKNVCVFMAGFEAGLVRQIAK
jgi:indolepyruvate ferredoxin oxidoreductase, beta subunit